VRRILTNHPLSKSAGNGPSWLSAIVEACDSLWSVDVFRCESILLRSLFWNGLDLHRKLNRFAAYYNQRRVHAGLKGRTPFER
jgi:hypothetical protein